MQKKKIIKPLLFALIIILIGISAYNVLNSYAVFYSEISGQTKANLAKWNITVNNTDITTGTSQSFTINTLKVEGNSNVLANKIAPGTIGSFDIIISPQDTQVSVRYDISIDTSALPSNIKLDSVTETAAGNTITKTAPDTYTGIIPLSSITSGYTNDIKISFSWINDESNNANDTLIGTTFGTKMQIPITVKVVQYLGETITGI